MLGLPAHVRACLFDLDGVLTQTAKVHAAAWKEMFDGCLRERAAREGTAFVPFDAVDDYDEYVDGRPRENGVEPYEGSVRFLHAVRAAGLRCAVVSSSANCRDVLEGAGIEDLFDERIEGVVAGDRGLRGKPAPDTCLEAARGLGLEPGAAAMFEDAPAGVEAGRAGRFGVVVGVDRTGQAEQPRAYGADVVVRDLAELLESR
ncbi:HAD-IA family hydrolase [Streptomyces sp. NPDC046915]|uniref:HAD family hydrolase n=1 Tax=Streptomyces sp. NPDC046915 TaxID=3155257 RepID=UPI0033ED6A6D